MGPGSGYSRVDFNANPSADTTHSKDPAYKLTSVLAVFAGFVRYIKL